MGQRSVAEPGGSVQLPKGVRLASIPVSPLLLPSFVGEQVHSSWLDQGSAPDTTTYVPCEPGCETSPLCTSFTFSVRWGQQKYPPSKQSVVHVKPRAQCLVSSRYLNMTAMMTMTMMY